MIQYYNKQIHYIKYNLRCFKACEFTPTKQPYFYIQIPGCYLFYLKYLPDIRQVKY